MIIANRFALEVSRKYKQIRLQSRKQGRKAGTTGEITPSINKELNLKKRNWLKKNNMSLQSKQSNSPNLKEAGILEATTSEEHAFVALKKDDAENPDSSKCKMQSQIDEIDAKMRGIVIVAEVILLFQ